MSDATGTFTAEDIRFGGGVGESDRALVAETMQEIIGRLGQLREQADARSVSCASRWSVARPRAAGTRSAADREHDEGPELSGSGPSSICVRGGT